MKYQLLLLCLSIASRINPSSQAAVSLAKPSPHLNHATGQTIFQPQTTILGDKDIDCDSDVVCPADPEDQFIANPWNCHSFYQCSDGRPILQPCPAGYVFDRDLNVCNDPADTECWEPCADQ